MANDRTVVIGAFGDTHCGSTIGLCPPTGVELDDGGTYLPSLAQRWIWDCWVAGWQHVANIVERERRIANDDVDLGIVCNGDATDGNHHGTTQILSPAEGAHIKCAVESFREPIKLKPRWAWMVRGTEAHVGKSAGLEEGIAVAWNDEGAPIQRCDTGAAKTWSWWTLPLEIHDKLIVFDHHGRMGQRAHTRASYVRLYAFDVWAERMMRGERAPDLAVRSHHHTYEDSGPQHPTRKITRVVQMPAYQLATAFVRRIAAESLADIGLVAIVIRPTGEIEVHPHVTYPSRGEPWRIPA